MPETIGTAIIAAVNFVGAEAAAVIAPEAFIVPFTTTSTFLGVSSASIVGAYGTYSGPRGFRAAQQLQLDLASSVRC